MSQRVKDLEGELEQKLQRSASQPEKNRFGVSKGSPYKGAPVPPPDPISPHKTRSILLPALRTIPHAPSPQRYKDEQAAQAEADANMDKSRNKELHRSQRSQACVGGQET